MDHTILAPATRELGEQAYESGHNRAYSQVKLAASKGLPAPKIDRTFPPEFRGRGHAEQRYLEGCEGGELKALDKYFPEKAAEIRTLAADLEEFAELPDVVRQEDAAVASFRLAPSEETARKIAPPESWPRPARAGIPTPTSGKLVGPEEPRENVGKPVTVAFLVFCVGLSFFITILWLIWR